MNNTKVIDPCNLSDLTPFQASIEKPWDDRRIKHLYRRIGYGIHIDQIQTVKDLSPQDVIAGLIEDAKSAPLLDPFDWNDYTEEDYRNNPEVQEVFNQWRVAWFRGVLSGSGLNEKLTMFWHNHFVTKIETYFCLPWMYEYHQIIHNNQFGNFKDFTYAIGRTPAMLLFLNGIQNSAVAPNENYARELYELFTLGRDNGYTQNDITETARALTGFQGWNGVCNPIEFTPISHDNGSKTIFGQTGQWGYDDVHNILFEEKGDLIANYLCEKLYAAFVSPELDYSITADLANTLVTSEFELEPVYRQLFSSEHFFDDSAIGATIKSPLDFIGMMYKETGIEVNDETLDFTIKAAGGVLGQNLYSPVDVAGWPGDKTWIDTERILLRWAISDLILANEFNNAPEAFRTIIKKINGDSNDVVEVVSQTIDYFTANGYHNQIDLDEAINTFKSDIPNNYFEDGSWNLDWDTVPVQTALLLSKIFQSPEYQLN